MWRILSSMTAVLLLLSAGTVNADDDANFRLTMLLEMNWDDSDMYRTYFGTADLYVLLSTGSDSAYVDYVENYMENNPDGQIPDFLGSVNGLGDMTVEGSGSSGDVSMTYEGTAMVTVTGSVIIHPENGQVLDVTLSGTTNEIWTAHTPDGDITMPQTAPVTPIHLIFNYGNDEIEINEPWDEGTSHQVFSLAIMEDPFTNPVYEGSLPDMD